MKQVRTYLPIEPDEQHNRASLLFFYYVTRVTTNDDAFDEPHEWAF